ncbi:unnamed protein product [Lathyrus oleraceus]
MPLSKSSLNLSANLGRVKQGDPDRVVLGRYRSPLPPAISVSTGQPRCRRHHILNTVEGEGIGNGTEVRERRVCRWLSDAPPSPPTRSGAREWWSGVVSVTEAFDWGNSVPMAVA